METGEHVGRVCGGRWGLEQSDTAQVGLSFEGGGMSQTRRLVLGVVGGSGAAMTLWVVSKGGPPGIMFAIGYFWFVLFTLVFTITATPKLGPMFVTVFSVGMLITAAGNFATGFEAAGWFTPPTWATSPWLIPVGFALTAVATLGAVNRHRRTSHTPRSE